MPLTQLEESSESFPFASSPHFLLVEDNRINMRILRTYIQKLDCTFDTATDGQQAVNAYHNANGGYQCVLMDISMPIMMVLRRPRQIRELEKNMGYTRCHIFAISGLASKDAQKEGFAAGLGLFLSKPVQFKHLSQVLRSSGII
jgi:CheY-like chemotaxis protein